MHLDGNGDSGGRIVFMAKEGITGIAMNTSVMPSGNTGLITRFLQGTMDDDAI